MKIAVEDLVLQAKAGEKLVLDAFEYSANDLLRVAAAAAGHENSVVIANARRGLDTNEQVMIMLTGGGAVMLRLDE
ncbi:MAG TPA: hypothetical protein VN851_00050 [Thermoanaerobaculia bacterium]|nr:hypothetical protein [Thermoanaerobaculia bacterium]